MKRVPIEDKNKERFTDPSIVEIEKPKKKTKKDEKQEGKKS